MRHGMVTALFVFTLFVGFVGGAPLRGSEVITSEQHGFSHTLASNEPILLPVSRSSDGTGIVSFLLVPNDLQHEETPLFTRLSNAKTRDQTLNAILGRKESHAGLLSHPGMTRKHNIRIKRPSESAKQKKQREKLEGIDWSIEQMPDLDDWKNQHAMDLRHNEIDIRNLDYDSIYTPPGKDTKGNPLPDKPYRYKGEAQRLQDEINPEGPVVHPGVHPITPHPGDFAQTGADFEVMPPEPMTPMPPYLYPPQFNGEFNYNVPPTYAAFYPKAAAVARDGTPASSGDDCVPVKDLPYIRSLAPSKMQDDYCVPSKFLPFYHPDTTPELAQQSASPFPLGEKGNPSQMLQPIVSSPQFDLPMPFAHGPMFPAFHPPAPGDPVVNPPPMVPLPAPANFNGNARRAPAMPMPPLPPAMWPYG